MSDAKYLGLTANKLAEIATNLEHENSRLRGLVAIGFDMARDFDGDRRLLRKLVQELYEDQCDQCDQWKYRDRMHALGVKVDDG